MTRNRKNTLVLFNLTALFIGMIGFAQEADKSNKQYHYTLDQAVNYSKQNNKTVAISLKEAAAAEEDRKNVKNEALPSFEFGASYERFSDLTLYTRGLSEHTSGPRRPSPNGGNTGINASLNLYSGGKLRSLEQEAKIKKGIANLNAQDQAGNIGLQTANSYLDLLQLNERKKFVTEQLKRAEMRLKNINALYQNQKVTRSDVLRVEVMLANIKLSLEQVENDLAIRNRALTVLMNLDQAVTIVPTDIAAMEKPIIESYSTVGNSIKQSSYPLQRASLLVESQEARLKTIKSNNYPTLSFRTAYNLNYPNYLFYPPVAQFYSIGFVGLQLRYDIASIYKNKHNSQAAKLRVEELQIQESAIRDNVNQELNAIYIKYSEALHRIEVNKTSIEQAKVNYKIVSTKYFNQLALLTDLLDADNLFEETQYNLVQAQVEAFRIYYRLQYLQGKL
jgi:outer membrane protein TolC